MLFVLVDCAGVWVGVLPVDQWRNRPPLLPSASVMAMVVPEKQFYYDPRMDVLPPGFVYWVAVPPPTTSWTVLGDQSQILHISLVGHMPGPVSSLARSIVVF